MPISKDIAPLLPDVRRFSAALNGSRASGDAYLTATLEYLLEDLSAFRRDLPPRLALYQLYLDVWSATCVPPPPVHQWTAPAVDRRLMAMSPRARQAFLLRSVEGFSVPDVAEIMRLDTNRASALLERGAHDIARDQATRILIIEDEPVIAMELESIVEDLGHHVVGIAWAGPQAVALAAERRPELIMADLQLADGSSGLDTVNEILSSASKPVVFITGDPGAFLSENPRRPEPASLLSKPFNPDSVSRAVSRALSFGRRATAVAR